MGFVFIMDNADIEAAKRELEGGKPPVTQTEPELDIRSAISTIAKAISDLKQEVNTLKNSPQTPISPTENQFSQIEGFARAMGSLKEYENKVITGYNQQRDSIRAEFDALAQLQEEEGESIEDTALKKLMDVIGNKMATPNPVNDFKNNNQSVTSVAIDPGSAGYPTQKPAPLIVPNEIHITSGVPPMEEKKTDNSKIIGQIPDHIKRGIKNGSLTKKEIKKGLTPEMLEGLGLKESDLDEVYEEIKGKS